MAKQRLYYLVLPDDLPDKLVFLIEGGWGGGQTRRISVLPGEKRILLSTDLPHQKDLGGWIDADYFVIRMLYEEDNDPESYPIVPTDYVPENICDVMYHL